MAHLSGGSFKNALLAPQLSKMSPSAYISYKNHEALFYLTPAAKAGIASTSLLLMLAEITAQWRKTLGLCTVQLALAFLALSPCPYAAIRHKLTGLNQSPWIKIGLPDVCLRCVCPLPAKENANKIWFPVPSNTAQTQLSLGAFRIEANGAICPPLSLLCWLRCCISLFMSPMQFFVLIA